MANIKKTFNFRNGVQVDEDNLIVNATGLVGIGTTIPTEALDVRGTTKVVGLVTSQEGFVGVFTAHTSSLGTVALSTSIIGAGVSIKSGIITSNAASGLVTYYGDARFLQGMPTSQWEDTNAGLGVSSIYNTGGTVGVGTTNPQFTLQVGSNVNGGEHGVGISSAGDIKASGIVTATGLDINGDIDVDGHTNLDNVSVAGVSTFIGNITGRVIGDVVGNINSSGVSTITTLNATNVNIAGLSTHRVAFTNASDNLTDSEDLTFNDTTNTLNIVGTTDTDQLNVSGVSTLGVSTFTGNVSFGSNAFIKDEKFLYMGDDSVFRIGHHAGPGHSQIKHDSAAQDLVLAADRIRIINRAENKGLARFIEGSFVALNFDGNEKLFTSGVGVTVYNQLDTTNIVASGVITATTELNSPLVGVGTDDPATDIQVRKAGAAQIRVTSDTDAAIVSVGRVAGAGNGTNAAFRYGNNSAGFPYSNSNALDIINYDIGNINFYLSASAQGHFHWLKGSNSSRLMTLTNTGLLGIGLTNPSEKLSVAGVATITSNLIVGGNATFGGNGSFGGNLTVSGNLNSNLTGNVTGNVTGNLTGNVNTTAGISSFKKIGINTTVPTSSVSLDCLQGNAVFNRVGIGSTEPDAIADFSGDLSTPSKKFIMLPKVSAGSTAAIQSESAVGGGLIYNTTLRKLQFYNGTNWETVTSVEVTG